MPSPLPKFDRPPVVEMAIGVQFAAITLPPLALASFWAPLRERFPVVETMPPLPRIREDFQPPSGPPSFTVEVSGGVVQPRYWMTSADGSRLLQVQPDRIVYNWRLQAGGDYPSYDRIRVEFDLLLAAYRAWLETELSQVLQPDYAEVVYINHVAPLAGGGGGDGVSRLLRGVSSPGQDLLLEPERSEHRWAFRIPGPTGVPVGRLRVSVDPIIQPRSVVPGQLVFEPMIAINANAVGEAGAGTNASELAFLDVAHEWIVRGFADVTTEEMHKVWGRTQ